MTTDTIDPCLSRHKGNEQSCEAWKRCSPEAMRSKILEFYAEGWRGTAKEFAATFDMQLNRISGRFSELRQRGKLRKTGVVRDGAAELEIVTTDGTPLENVLTDGINQVMSKIA